MTKALIVVDMQNDFSEAGRAALPVPGSFGIIPMINRLMISGDYIVVLTQDWHPKGHHSFASMHKGAKPFDKLNGETLWPDHCIAGFWGSDFMPGLYTDLGTIIQRKGMRPYADSYSAFYDNSHEFSTGLAGWLRERGVTEVDVCGLALDVCVAYTAKDAAEEGFKSRIISNASRSINPIFELVKGVDYVEL